MPKSLARGTKGPNRTTQNLRMTKMRACFWNMLGQEVDKQYKLKARGMTYRTVPLTVRLPDGNGHVVKCKGRLDREDEEDVEHEEEAPMVERSNPRRSSSGDPDQQMLPQWRPLQVPADFALIAFIWDSAQAIMLR